MPTYMTKYNVPGPRYTSYPTVPYWDEQAPSQTQWKALVKESFDISNKTEGISLYIHLPFCESLCTYCGCNTRITTNHEVEMPYIQALLKEWKLYLGLFGETPRISEIHLGGGTPTFFQAEQLRNLIEGIFEEAEKTENIRMSFEAHPKNTTGEHLQTLFDLGFRRVSLGIQDFDPKVQEIINRVQSFEQVKDVTELARKIGYASINYDLIYGLPLQTNESIKETIEKVALLKPDRIAFYGYAHVPWIKPGQRKYTDEQIPKGEEKQFLYEWGRVCLQLADYIEIGMDHFAMPEDSLYQAVENETLHRNFMGYTESATRLMIGLGASSISDSWNGFVQNEKKVEDYYARLEEEKFPFFKGHVLNEEDLILRKHILNIMCRLETSWKDTTEQCQALYDGLGRMNELEKDTFVEIAPHHLKVTRRGKSFIRNVCMALDARLWRKQPEVQLFSTTI